MEDKSINTKDREAVLSILGLPNEATESEMEKAVASLIKSKDQPKLKKLLPALDRLIKNSKPNIFDRLKGKIF